MDACEASGLGGSAGDGCLWGPSIIRAVVSEGMCIGCGVCVGVCPRRESGMRLSAVGLWEPELDDNGCPAACGRCGQACPFGSETRTEEEISCDLFAGVSGVQLDECLGYWSSCHVGHHPDAETRFRAASGGVVTWILEAALESGLVDSVVNVQDFDASVQGFAAQVACTKEDIR